MSLTACCRASTRCRLHTRLHEHPRQRGSERVFGTPFHDTANPIHAVRCKEHFCHPTRIAAEPGPLQPVADGKRDRQTARSDRRRRLGDKVGSPRSAPI